MSVEGHWIEARIARRRIEAEDILSLDLVAADGEALPHFSAGAHVDIEVAPGTIRQYSLCNSDADRTHYQVAVLRDPASRGGSVAIHERMHEGDAVRISAPRNHFPLQQTAGRSILIGGGIGVTPLLCMAERLQRSGARYHLHYCTRSPERTAFRERIAETALAANASFHFDSEGSLLDPAALFAGLGGDDHIYVCGPAGFIAWIEAAANAADVPAANFHREYFAAPDSTGEESEGARAFEVRIASTGQVIAVAADEAVTTALSNAGIELPISCDQGVCGTCITRVIEGEPEHRDLLGLSGNAEFTPCCSRAKTALLVLDL